MEKKYKVYAKLNLMSLFFIAVSFISITLAWFAYSGLAKVSTEIDVKAWYIEFQQGTKTVSNNIIISTSEIYPGMDPVTEKINIKNLGDSDAQITYSIVEARILDENLDSTSEEGYLEDKLSHEYPFHINVNLSKKYAVALDGSSELEVSLSWPLDSDNDTLDSTWGSLAYKFQKSEEEKLLADETYQIRPSIKIIISVKAEQSIITNDSIDSKYNLGDIILYDVEKNESCTEMSSTCLKTYIIDLENKVGDTNVTLLPDLYNTYTEGSYNDYTSLFTSITSNWNVTTRTLVAEDLLKIISTDVVNSYLIRDGLSDLIIGNLQYKTRATEILQNAISYNGYYRFNNQKFPYFLTSKCYWINTNYNDTSAFALKKIDDTYSKIYPELKESTCNVVPVIIASKTNLES